MKKTKLSLEDLNVKSFKTSKEVIESVKAGVDPSVRSFCYRNSTCQACNEPTYWC